MFLVSVVHDLIFLKLLLYSFHAGQGSANSIKRICVSGWFVPMEITTAHPILTIMFKNILRTFTAEILKIFKNIEPQQKKLVSLVKVYSSQIGRDQASYIPECQNPG